MQFVRDNDAVTAILAGAGSRPAEELVTALRKVSPGTNRMMQHVV